MVWETERGIFRFTLSNPFKKKFGLTRSLVFLTASVVMTLKAALPYQEKKIGEISKVGLKHY